METENGKYYLGFREGLWAFGLNHLGCLNLGFNVPYGLGFRVRVLS